MKIKSSMHLTLSPEFKKLRGEYDLIKTELAKLVSERDILTETVRKNLEALYIVKIGALEYKLFCTECDASRLRRKIELIQARLNRAEKISAKFLLLIKVQLDSEYQKWEQEIKDLYAGIESSKHRLSSLLTPAQSKKLQDLYRRLVKKLHPDVNPNLSDNQKILWHRLIEAYKSADIEELITIELLVKDIADDIFSETDEAAKTAAANAAAVLERIKKEINYIKEKVYKVALEIKEIKNQFPFTIQADLENKAWVNQKNAETLAKIEEASKRKSDLLKVIDDLLLGNVGFYTASADS